MSDIHKFQYEKRDLPNCPCRPWPFSPAIILNFTTALAPNSWNEHCIKTHLLHLKSFAVIRRELLHILSPLPPLPGTLTKALLPTDKGSHWADLWTPQRLNVISSQLSLLRTQPRPDCLTLWVLDLSIIEPSKFSTSTPPLPHPFLSEKRLLQSPSPKMNKALSIPYHSAYSLSPQPPSAHLTLLTSY